MIEARDLPSSWDDAQIRLEIALRWARKEVAIGAAGLKRLKRQGECADTQGPRRTVAAPLLPLERK